MIKLIVILFVFNIYSLTSENKEIKIIHSLNKLFESKNVNGIFIISSLDNIMNVANNNLYDRQYLPASTFKIPNSIIALETGILKDENEIIKWDGKKRWIDSWNQDTDLKLGMKNSTVWFYQEIARRIGELRMQEYLNSFDYGNKNIGGGIDKFWLEGDLKISPKEQIEFLKKVYMNKLKNVSERTIEITKRIMLKDSTDEYLLRAKTGWAIREDYVGWYVGWVETKNTVYFFATCIQPQKDKENLKNLISDEKFTKARIEITYELLRELKIIK